METLDRLIEILSEERGEASPKLTDEQKPDYFRALCNVRPPAPITDEFLRLEAEYLSARLRKGGVTEASSLNFRDGVALFRGDITTLNADAIVNAGNAAMLGCFRPLHGCIDNAIHSAAGVRLRLDCNEIMKGREAKNGEVVVTKGYNLPCKFVFHTVGPVVYGRVTDENRVSLRRCYDNCLEKADEMRLKTVAFCCISTGVFGYPQEEAARLAASTVKDYLARTKSGLKVIFDVFTEKDYEIYGRILG